MSRSKLCHQHNCRHQSLVRKPGLDIHFYFSRYSRYTFRNFSPLLGRFSVFGNMKESSTFLQCHDMHWKRDTRYLLMKILDSKWLLFVRTPFGGTKYHSSNNYIIINKLEYHSHNTITTLTLVPKITMKWSIKH